MENRSVEELRDVMTRFRNMRTELSDVRDDYSELKKEAKGNGFDVKVIEKLLKEEEMDAEKRAKKIEEDLLLQTYRDALENSE